MTAAAISSRPSEAWNWRAYADGWLLAVGYDPIEHRSRLLVLDASDLEHAPLFTGHLHHHVPQGFHGTFTKRVAHSDNG